ncbi:putative Rhs family protein, partial [Candidatus Termititenax persephonae]
DPLNNITTYRTDRLGRLDTITLADNREYRYTYDEVGRPTKMTYPDGTHSERRYEDGNNSTLAYDENGHGMEYWRDAHGNLTKVVRGDIQGAGTIRYEYALDSLNKYTTPLRHETSFENDLLGRRLKKTQPDNTYETFEYDDNSNLTRHTNYENRQTNYTYDGLNRIKRETYPDAGHNVIYTYDEGGANANALTRLTKVEDGSGTTEYKYNSLGLITEEKKELEGATYVTAYEYDNTGLLQGIEYPQTHGQNIKVSYEYDELDRIKGLKLNGAALITNTYDNVGRLTRKDYGNGVRETYKYDAKDRLTEHEARKGDGGQVFLYKYEYDAAGNMVQRDITDGNVLRRRDSYEYDYINQLRKVDLPGSRDLELEYDRHLNRTGMAHGFGTTTYNYDTAMNTLLEYREDLDGDGAYERSVQYAYDKQGNPTQKRYVDIRTGTPREVARETYTWNDRDELTKITGRVTESYVYDYRGLRHIKDSNGDITEYVYLQNNQPALVYDVTSNSYQGFIYEGNKRVAKIALHAARPPTTEILLNNYQGSVIAVLGEDGSINYQKYLDPWGNMRPSVVFSAREEVPVRRGAQGEMEVGNPSSNINFQYTDKELDTNTDLYYFQARYYDPYTNHFMGRDRVHLEDNPMNYFGMNAYLFVNNNPMRYVDADGEYSIHVYSAKHGVPGRLVLFNAQKQAVAQYTTRTSGINTKRSIAGGDTPIATYVVDNNRILGGKEDSRLGESYGTGWIGTTQQTVASGSRWASPKNSIGIHGGGSNKELVQDPYALLQGWADTEGCIRMQNQDVNSLIQQVKSLEASEIANSLSEGIKNPIDYMYVFNYEDKVLPDFSVNNLGLGIGEKK